jgi:hypothetical protein
MKNKQCFEALDRSLRDINSEKDSKLQNVQFGGKVVVLGRDPKQKKLYLHENIHLKKLRQTYQSTKN